MPPKDGVARSTTFIKSRHSTLRLQSAQRPGCTHNLIIDILKIEKCVSQWDPASVCLCQGQLVLSTQRAARWKFHRRFNYRKRCAASIQRQVSFSLEPGKVWNGFKHTKGRQIFFEIMSHTKKVYLTKWAPLSNAPAQMEMWVFECQQLHPAWLTSYPVEEGELCRSTCKLTSTRPAKLTVNK